MAEIVSVVYTASDGTTWPFQMEKLIRIKKANFHNWTYNPNTQKRRFGVRVLNFGKAPAAYQTTLYFGGSVEYRKKTIDDFHTAIERDINKNEPGVLTWRDWEIKCFIRSSSTYPEENNEWTINDVEVYCPYPFWSKPTKYEYFKTDTGSIYRWLDYDYDYEYDYKESRAYSNNILNDGINAADFKITFFGAAINPQVIITSLLDETYSVRHGVNITLAEGEYLTIDSRDKTILRHTNNGKIVNEFDSRTKGDVSVFSPIALGNNRVAWPNTFDMEIVVFDERSEPKWN